MEELHGEVPDRHVVAALDRDEVRGGEPGQAMDERQLRLVDDHLGRHLSDQLRRAPDLVPHEVAAQVVGVEVRDQVLRDPVAVGLGGLDERVDVPGRIDDGRLVRGRIPEQVCVVLHRPDLELLEVDRMLHGSLRRAARSRRARSSASRLSGRSQRNSFSPR